MRIGTGRALAALSGLAILTFVVASIARPAPVAGGSLSGLKANLDLPYRAGGRAEEEELAPEMIFFYGAGYEADSVVFALDASGSMKSESRWTLQTREVIRAMTQLSKSAEFGLLYFSSGVTPFRESPVNATATHKAAAGAFIYSRQPAGDTCLFEGLTKALQIARKSSTKRRTIILTSDGRPDICSTGDRATPQQIEMLLAQSVASNPGLEVTVHTIWVGSGGDSEAIQFMKRLAAMHGGTFRQVAN